jgi:hypothetical protein
MTHNLAWMDDARIIGQPTGRRLKKPTDVMQIRLATVRGCLLAEHPMGYGCSAGWVAAVWKVSGSPVVVLTEWKDAMVKSKQNVREGHHDIP